MAKRKSSRRTHVSPGVYYKETELQYATKSLGITTLGLAGETLKGPAFQPISISDWSEYQSYFGGTSTEKFRGSQYPKYELPYIAKEFLKQSKQLEVVRTLGLSGVNAGPAWIISATKHDCGIGYEYVQKYETDDDVVEKKSTYPTIDAAGIMKGENGFYNNVTFKKPGPVVLNNPTDANPLETEIGVMDAHINADSDIIYLGQGSEEYFDKLPKGIQEEFGDYKTLYDYADANNWGGAFFYIGLDGDINTGKLAVTYELGDKGVVALYYDDITNCVEASHTEEEYLSTCTQSAKSINKLDEYKNLVNYKYIIVPKSILDNILEKYITVYDEVTNPNGYSSESDFNSSISYSNKILYRFSILRPSGSIGAYIILSRSSFASFGISGSFKSMIVLLISYILSPCAPSVTRFTMFSAHFSGFFFSLILSSFIFCAFSITSFNNTLRSLNSGKLSNNVFSPTPLIPFILSDESPHIIFLSATFW